MRPTHNNNQRRHRNNNRGGYNNRGNNGGGNRPFNRNHSHDSVNPAGGRLRGTAQQLMEKYQELARAAAAAGDSTLAENQLQHAEHYARVLNEHLEATGARMDHNQNDSDGHDDGDSEVTTYPPVQAQAQPRMPEEQPSLGDFDPPEFLRPKN
ncbi:MAG TPA: DUF4167 domain-containing protein [Alphaproteobacteria bacterium]|nr:DUF4167 domain-containing protein [Rhodospirillaceae bacterium]HRJ12804.1 DUF4167 domain-containing protein [Alphaproteobacteria bacterium]